MSDHPMTDNTRSELVAELRAATWWGDSPSCSERLTMILVKAADALESSPPVDTGKASGHPVFDRLLELARLQTVYAEKLARTNATIPDYMTCTKGENDAYQLLYQASEAAGRVAQRAALKFLADTPALVTALSSPQQREGEWQSIESAPKEKIILAAKLGTQLVSTAYFFGQLWRHPHSDDPLCFCPSHWQPLPKPPALNGDK